MKVEEPRQVPAVFPPEGHVIIETAGEQMLLYPAAAEGQWVDGVAVDEGFP